MQEKPSKNCRVDVVIKTSTGGLWIVEQVEEIIRRGHEVRVILPSVNDGHLANELARRGISTVRSPFDFAFSFRFRTLRDLFRLRRLIKSGQADVVMYHLYASTLAARLTTLGLPVRRVHMVAGPLFLESTLIRLVEKILCRLDHVIINGCDEARRLYAKLGYPGDRMFVVSYGTDMRRFSIDSLVADKCRSSPPGAQTSLSVRSQTRAHLSVGEEEFLAIMVAYVYAPKKLTHAGAGIKGHHVLLRAWEQFIRENRNSHLLLVGGGQGAIGERYRKQLVQQFNTDTSTTITWLDSVDDVRQFYLAADVSISPSLSEGHGAVPEASAMQVPSIVSDAGGLPETNDMNCGWQVARNDEAALLEALNDARREFDQGKLSSRGVAARRFAAARFDRAACASRVADIVEQESMLCRKSYSKIS